VVPSEVPSTSDAADIPLAPEAKQAVTGERITTTSSTPIADIKCPSCSAQLSEGAILCVNCGYNLNTGKKLAAVVVETEGEDEEAEESPADAEERA
jgi:hypothetical protein